MIDHTQIQAAQTVLSRIASDTYRLRDMSSDRSGSDVYSDEVMAAIRELGFAIEILSDLLEVEEYRGSMANMIGDDQNEGYYED